MFIEVSLFSETSPALKNSWLRYVPDISIDDERQCMKFALTFQTTLV